MSVVWTITREETTKSLAAWGIASPKLTRRNLDVDELTFRMARADVLAEPIFAYGDELYLKADGVTRFRGKVTRLPAAGSKRGERDEFIVSGPWWQLANLTYQQPRKVKNEDFSGFDTEDTTRVILGQSELGARITTGVQIAEIITYALTQNAIMVAGTVPAFVTAPLDECRDITCAEAIRRQLAFTPDAVGWFDYSSEVPTFNVQKRAELTAEEIDLADADLVEVFSLTPRNDLVPAGVVFIYITTEVNDDKTWSRLTRDTAGLTSGIGVVTSTIEMMGAGTENQETPPIGLAAEYFAALQTLPWEGTLTTHARDCTGNIHPGKVLNLAGGRAAWATMRGVVQEVTEDLARGVTEIEFGPPEHLGPQDFVAMMMFNRKTARPPEATNFATVKPPQKADGSTNTAAGEDPKSNTAKQTSTGASAAPTSHTVTTCEDGVESEKVFYGPPG